MGQTLSEPVTEKESAHCQNDEYAVSTHTHTHTHTCAQIEYIIVSIR